MTIRTNRQTKGTETVTIKCDKCETTTRVLGASPTDHATARAIAARSSWSIWHRRNPVPIRDLCPAHARRR